MFPGHDLILVSLQENENTHPTRASDKGEAMFESRLCQYEPPLLAFNVTAPCPGIHRSDVMAFICLVSSSMIKLVSGHGWFQLFLNPLHYFIFFYIYSFGFTTL